VQVAVLAQLGNRERHDRSRKREAEPFAAAGLCPDERVQSHEPPVHVHERTAAVARVDRGVGLHVGDRTGGLHLPRHSAHEPHRYGIAETVGTAEGEHQLALIDRRRIGDRQ